MEHPITLVSIFPQFIQDKYTHVIMLAIVVILAVLMGFLAKRMTSEVPTKGQVVMEWIIRQINGLGESILGKEGLVYMPLIFGIGFYVAVSNMLGLIPGFIPPTSNMNTTAAPAILVFFFYQYLGFKKHGIGYLKSFMGPIALLAPLMFFIEVIGHFARPLSLTMRLFGNITGEEIVIVMLFSLVPFLVPLPMYFLLAFSGLLQAFVFMLLTMIYISGALEEAH